ESLCESVDVKTEAEAPDFAAWQASLNAIMPAGIRVFRVEPARDKASAIAFACYTIRYPAAAAGCLAGYNALDAAPVEKKGKKGSKQVDLKAYIPALDRSEEHTSELQSRFDLVCRLLLEIKNEDPEKKTRTHIANGYD